MDLFLSVLIVFYPHALYKGLVYESIPRVCYEESYVDLQHLLKTSFSYKKTTCSFSKNIAIPKSQQLRPCYQMVDYFVVCYECLTVDV